MSDTTGSFTSLPEAVFEEVRRILGLPTEERDAPLEAVCRRYPKFAERIRASLETVLAGDVPQSLMHLRPGDMVDRYEIRGVLGAGGMGTVYRARQEEPRREVALKIIRPGVASADAVSRFKLERKALAAMNHRYVAKMLDAGQTQQGLPYFVMELVDGVSLIQFCDERRLSLADRLRLFQRICQGVQHAHQKSLIHRDLTPRNVLVVQEGDEAIPKIVDFGLAKATDRDLAVTLNTAQGAVMGTPGYMSPEQAAGSSDRVDARSDIYALGVMLYELLTGTLPFPKVAVLEVLRLIREADPPRPSTRVVEPLLARELRRDLDWVVLRAMAKEPERRYDSAAAFADDLGRYLSREPVLAGPPTAGYRLRKFVARRRAESVAALLILGSLLASTAFVAAHAAEATASVRREKAANLITRSFHAAESSPELALLYGLAAHDLSPGAGVNGVLANAIRPLRAKWTYVGDGQTVGQLRASTDGRQLLAVRQSGGLVLDAATGEVLHRVPSHEPLIDLRSSDDAFVLITADKVVQRWHPDRGFDDLRVCLWQPQEQEAETEAGDEEDEARNQEIEKLLEELRESGIALREPLAMIRAHDHVDPKGRFAAQWTSRESIQFWDLLSGEAMGKTSAQGRVDIESCFFADTGQFVSTVEDRGSGLRRALARKARGEERFRHRTVILDPATGEVACTVHGRALAVSKRGDRIATWVAANHDPESLGLAGDSLKRSDEVWFWDVSSGECFGQQYAGGCQREHLRFSDDLSYVIVFDKSAARLIAVDRKGRNRVPLSANRRDLVLDSGGKRLATADQEGRWSVVALPLGTESPRNEILAELLTTSGWQEPALENDGRPSLCAVFVGDCLATADDRGWIRLHDTTPVADRLSSKFVPELVNRAGSLAVFQDIDVTFDPGAIQRGEDAVTVHFGFQTEVVGASNTALLYVGPWQGARWLRRFDFVRAETTSLIPAAEVTSLAVDPADRHVALLLGSHVEVRDARDGSLVSRWPLEDGSGLVRFADDGASVLLLPMSMQLLRLQQGFAKEVLQCRVADGKVIHRWAADGVRVADAAYLAGSDRLVVFELLDTTKAQVRIAARDRTIARWPQATTVVDYSAPADRFAVEPSGQRVAIRSGHSVLMADPRSGATLWSQTFEDRAIALGADWDRGLVMVHLADGRTLLLRADLGRVVREVPVEPRASAIVGFDVANDYLVRCSVAGLEITSLDPVAEARRRKPRELTPDEVDRIELWTAAERDAYRRDWEAQRER